MWHIFEGPLEVLVLAVVLTIAAMALLREYRRLFFSDPKSVMSAEVLFQALTGTGGPGYLAAFLLAGAALSVACALISFILNLSSYVAR